MRCATITIDEQSRSVTDDIVLPVRDSQNGPFVWLGFPFVTYAYEGRQNRGSYCSTFGIDRALLGVNVHYRASDSEAYVCIRECALSADNKRIISANSENSNGAQANVPAETEYTTGAQSNDFTEAGNTTRVQSNDSTDVLLLVRLSKTKSAKCDQPGSPQPVGEGYLINYRSSRPSRHPVRYTCEEVDEKLYKLGEGKSVLVNVLAPAARVFGIAIHKGEQRTLEIKNTGGTITVNEIALTPLNVPDYDQDACDVDLVSGGACALFGAMCGVLATNTNFLLGGISGALAGVATFLLIMLAKFAVSRASTPPYTSPTPFQKR